MALLPDHYLDAVVSIGVTKKGKFQSLATGFLVGFKTIKKTEKGFLYTTFLVTNRHVFEDLTNVTLRFNLTQEGYKAYNLTLEDAGVKKWVAHPNNKVDIGAIPINTTKLKKDNIRFSRFIEGMDVAFLETIKNVGISQGDSIFVLGFPMGIAGEGRNYVLVRGGIISRLDGEIIKNNNLFLIDAAVFPGNSGGPVILKPELSCLQGTKAVKEAYVIGVVKSYLPYKDEAVSKQTGETRIVFIENSGIAGVVPMDFVKETIQPLMPKDEPEDIKQANVEKKIDEKKS